MIRFPLVGYYQLPSPVEVAKHRVRHALREMLCFAPLVALCWWLIVRPVMNTAEIVGIALVGIAFCPAPWIIYRFGRFIVGR